MRKLWIVFALLSLFSVGMAQDAPVSDVVADVVTTREAPDPDLLALEEVATGFTYPLFVTHVKDGSGRLFVLEQAGLIWILQDGERLEAPFIDLTDVANQTVLSGYSEGGLLGLAFHPNYTENGYFYVNYTASDTASHVVRYTVSEDDPNVADPESASEVLSLSQPFSNHNGGHLEFGRDGYLYISFGDGGAANDPLKTGQDPSDWYGSLLRIDVDTDDDDAPYRLPSDNPAATQADFAPEVWAYGLRNAWRFSFDRATGDLYVADVGQNQWEEVNFLPADAPAGANFGWSNYEGSHIFATSVVPEGMIYPIVEYAHGQGDCSITGGYVYRGEAVESLDGVYLYGDYCSGRVWGAYRDLDGAWQSLLLLNVYSQVSSFGEDEAGEVYVVDYGGKILRVVNAE